MFFLDTGTFANAVWLNQFFWATSRYGQKREKSRTYDRPIERKITPQIHVVQVLAPKPTTQSICDLRQEVLLHPSIKQRYGVHSSVLY
jgi:hypothetical protein